MSEDNHKISILAQDNFLKYSALFVILLSVFLRSIVDIGADTGVYISLGQKIANGSRYYYDFFESNFPLSFYFYALQHKIALFFNINPIILSEIVINILALLSITYSAKSLRYSTIYQNSAHYNLLILSYLCGFFLRPQALQIGEFGTKTSLLLILLYPYMSLSFERVRALNKAEMISRGIFMGLMPCLKPHYLLLIIPIEIQRFYCKKSCSFFYQLDKLTFALIGVVALFLMIKFTPEYFEFIVPMWPKIYAVYDDWQVFFKNIWHHIAARIAPFALIFLLFSRLKFSANDKILALFFLAASLLIIVESVANIDQVVVFYAIVTSCFFKFTFDLLQSGKFSFSDNRFIILTLIFIPLADLAILPASIFALGGFVNIWWLILPCYPLLLTKKERSNFLKPKIIIIALIAYIAVLVSAYFILKNFSGWVYISFNLTLLFVVLFAFEKRIYAKFYAKFSPFFVFIVTASFSCLLYAYVVSIIAAFKHDSEYSFPNKISDFTTYYSQKYAQQKDEEVLMLSVWIAHKFPMVNYLNKNNYQKFYGVGFRANEAVAGSNLMFKTNDLDKNFTLSYLFDDIKKQIKDQRIKAIFINNTPKILNHDDHCLIGSLEYYFLDPEFKKLFLQNFHFENRVIITHKVKPLKNVHFITGDKKTIFDKVEPSTIRVLHDFEVYIRNET